MLVELARATVLLPVRVVRASYGVLVAAEQVPELLARIDAILSAIEQIVASAAEVTEAAATVVRRVDETRAQAADLVDRVTGLQRRATDVFDRLDPLLTAATKLDPGLIQAADHALEQLMPMVRNLVGVDSDLPAQAARLTSRSLSLLDEVDGLVLPILTEMRAAVPDVRKILPVVQRLEPVMVDVETRIAGLPGAARLRKRGEQELEQASEDE